MIYTRKYAKYNLVKLPNYLIVLAQGVGDIGENDWYLKDNHLVLKCTKRIRKTKDGKYISHGNISDIHLEENLVCSGDEHCDKHEKYIGRKLNPNFNLKRILAHLPLNGSPVLEGLDLLPKLKRKESLDALTQFKCEELFSSTRDSDLEGFLGIIRWRNYSEVKNIEYTITGSKPRTINNKDNLPVWYGRYL